MGCEEARGAVARRSDVTDAEDDQPDLEAARVDWERKFASAGAKALRAFHAERGVADGWEGRVSRQRWNLLSVVDRRRSQPVCRGTLFVAGVYGRADLSLSGAHV